MVRIIVKYPADVNVLAGPEVDNFTLIVIFAFMQIIPTQAITILLAQMKNYTNLYVICIFYTHSLIFYDLHANPNNSVIISEIC